MSSIKPMRDERVDILRFIAIVCIILAHSKPVEKVFEIRNFDVTLMALLLGTSFYLSTKDKKMSYMDYMKKRFKKLILPTWGFLTFFFILFYVISLVDHSKYYYSKDQAISSYMLNQGIGYVWVIKVFFIVALVNPFILFVSQKITSHKKYFFIIGIGFVVYSGFLYVSRDIEGFIEELLENFVLQGIGYSLIGAIGIRIKQISNKGIFILSILFFILFMFLRTYYNYEEIQMFKYPPGLYYISYGLFVSLSLYGLLEIKIIKNMLNNRFIYFISSNSLWLYLWHIIPDQIILFFGANTIFEKSFFSRFTVIFLGALSLLFIQENIKKHMYLKNNTNMKNL